MPAPSEVLVKVKYTGINPVETYMRSGTYTFIPKLPWIPGSEASGTVEALGCDVKAPLKVGQKVFLTGRNNTGAYAEYVTAKEEYVYSLGERLSYAQGAALGIAYFTAYKVKLHSTNSQP